MSPFALHSPIDSPPTGTGSRLAELKVGPQLGRQAFPFLVVAVVYGADAALFQPASADAQAIGFEIPVAAVRAEHSSTNQFSERRFGETDHRIAPADCQSGSRQLLRLDDVHQCREGRTIAVGISPDAFGEILLPRFVWPRAVLIASPMGQVGPAISWRNVDDRR